MFKNIIFFTTVFTLVVVVVGAFVRLTNAGLGCPDWPGCYGQLTPTHAAQDIAKAVAEQGGVHGPVSIQKAWYEMFHRYLAGALGLLILSITVMAWTQRARLAQSPWLASALLMLVMFQAALGMWTVTMLLKPVIVTLHLLGGMATLALLTWLAARQLSWPPHAAVTAVTLRPWAALGLVLLVAQIALGGWVSTNYAALACIDLPTCHGEWMPRMDFQHGFQLLRELGQTAAGGKLSYDALTAIHWTHRVGAVVVTLYLAWLAWRVAKEGMDVIALVIGVLLAAQVTLGIGNILTGLKLAVAVAHNAGAALLLAALVVLNSALSASPNPRRR